MSEDSQSQASQDSPDNLILLSDQISGRFGQGPSGHSTPAASHKNDAHPKVKVFHSNALAKTAPAQITFNRRELNEILRIYGFKVAAGEWRDYAIDHLKDRAVFSIFRKNGEIALYRIEKDPKLARRQGAYSVISVAGMVLKRGSDLRQVLKVFEKKPKFQVL